jgi:hypothetical protein
MEATNGLSEVKTFKGFRGDITVTVGLDASVTENFTPQSLHYDKFYKGTAVKQQNGVHVGAAVIAVDAKAGTPTANGGQRVWADALKLQSYTVFVPSAKLEQDTPWRASKVNGGLKPHIWFADSRSLAPTTENFVDYAGMDNAAVLQAGLKDTADDAYAVTKVSYAVAILCLKDKKIIGEPLDSFTYSTELTVKTNSVNIVFDFGWTYKEGGDISKWEGLRNWETGNPFALPAQ